eukprot:TRINITY_DN4143_c0_g1_i1.p1 TRINITY_DN4143_c0_g1~~TRINITY_DN4143_c0_g1_i1.p1  ORF type:complete len:389 (+),score=77.57 TRINITY_DN4143_c0_g1_i1:26-1168(+)
MPQSGEGPITISDETKEKLKAFCGKPFVAAVDIGGTNVRFAVGNLAGEYVDVVKFLSSSTRTIVKVFRALSDEVVELMGGHSLSACLAAAGRVMQGGDKVVITNYPGGQVDQDLVATELPCTLFPVGHSRFLNDLEAACYGVSALSSGKRFEDSFCKLWGDGPKDRLVDEHHLVLAIGTGLGVGLLMSTKTGHRNQKEFVVLPLEAGHTIMTPYGKKATSYEEQNDMFTYLGQQLYDGKQCLEFEDICSGRGLVACYGWLARDKPELLKNVTAKDVVDRAKPEVGDELALKAVTLHYAYLARASSNLAICLQAKGVIWCGDNQVHNRVFVEQQLDNLQTHFKDHTKGQWLQSVPVYCQTQFLNLNVEGAVFLANTLHSLV